MICGATFVLVEMTNPEKIKDAIVNSRSFLDGALSADGTGVNKN